MPVTICILLTNTTVMSGLLLYCATSMIRDTRNIWSKMSFFVCPKSPTASRILSKFLIFVQISSKIVIFLVKNAKFRDFVRFSSKTNLMCPYSHDSNASVTARIWTPWSFSLVQIIKRFSVLKMNYIFIHFTRKRSKIWRLQICLLRWSQYFTADCGMPLHRPNEWLLLPHAVTRFSDGFMPRISHMWYACLL